MQKFKILIQTFKPSGKWHEEEIEILEGIPICFPDGTSFPHGENIRKEAIKKYGDFYDKNEPMTFDGSRGFIIVTPYYNDENGNPMETKSFPTLIKL